MNISSAAAGCTLAVAVAMATAGAANAAPQDPYIVPFEQATIVDPATVTYVVGGVIGPDGTNLCAVNPGSIAFPDGTYPCFTGIEGLPGVPSQPQVAQMPVGGADTGAELAASKTTDTVGTALTVCAATALLGACAFAALRRRAVRS